MFIHLPSYVTLTHIISQLQQQIKSGTPMHLEPLSAEDRSKSLITVFKSDQKYINFEASCSHRHGATAHLLESIGINTKEIEILEETLADAMTTFAYRTHSIIDSLSLLTTMSMIMHIKIAPFSRTKIQTYKARNLKKSPTWDEPKKTH